jgi:hypothetical protein
LSRTALRCCCRRIIRTLNAEKGELLTNLHVAKSPLNEVKDNKTSSELVRLLDLTDRYDAQIKSEKLKVTCVYVYHPIYGVYMRKCDREKN